MRIITVVILGIIFSFVTLVKEGKATFENKGGLQYHGSTVVDNSKNIKNGDIGIANTIKAAVLPDFPSKTFGDAVKDYKYFTKIEWKQTKSSHGKVYVDFTGWLKKQRFDIVSIKNGISAKAVGIKFIVNSDGTYGAVMISKIESKTDGNIYSVPLDDLKVFLNKIYKNEEIKF